jgi:hypothetical protein
MSLGDKKSTAQQIRDKRLKAFQQLQSSDVIQSTRDTDNQKYETALNAMSGYQPKKTKQPVVAPEVVEPSAQWTPEYKEFLTNLYTLNNNNAKDSGLFGYSRNQVGAATGLLGAGANIFGVYDQYRANKETARHNLVAENQGWLNAIGAIQQVDYDIAANKPMAVAMGGWADSQGMQDVAANYDQLSNYKLAEPMQAALTRTI